MQYWARLHEGVHALYMHQLGRGFFTCCVKGSRLKEGGCPYFVLSWSTSIPSMATLFYRMESGLVVCSFGLAWGFNLLLLSNTPRVVHFSIPLVVRSLAFTVDFLTVELLASIPSSGCGGLLEPVA